MTNVNEMIALLEAHIANEAVVVNTNEEAEMNTQSNVDVVVVNMSIAELNDTHCVIMDNAYEWYTLKALDATTTEVRGVHKVLEEEQMDVLQYAETLTTRWEYRMVGEELVAVLDDGDVVYVNTCDIQSVRMYHKQVTGDRVADAIFFCTEEMDMVKITFIDNSYEAYMDMMEAEQIDQRTYKMSIHGITVEYTQERGDKLPNDEDSYVEHIVLHGDFSTLSMSELFTVIDKEYSTHCHHDYDCCGHFYQDVGTIEVSDDMQEVKFNLFHVRNI